MIKNQQAMSMSESLQHIENAEVKDSEIKGFIKKFGKIKSEKAKELRKDLESLDSMKIKPEHIAKIIDLLPEDASDINKIFTDVGLDEDETKKILETVKKFR